MDSLFNDPSEKILFDVPDAEVIYYPNFFEDRSDELFEKLYRDVPWQQDNITVYGKVHAQPRLTALYGNEGKLYSYSNIIMNPHPWTPLLTFIKERVVHEAGVDFTTVLLNLYRDGRDSNGWHSDNEKELGTNPVIASVSLGAVRSFHLKHIHKDAKLKIELGNGSLLLMKGSTQHFWKHQIPKTARLVGPRLNLTFRSIK